MNHVDIDAIEALHLAAMRVQGAPEGTSNDILKKEAHGLRELVAAGRLDRTHVENVLEDAALAAGLDIDEARATIRSGLNAGIRDKTAAMIQKTSLVTQSRRRQG